MQFNIITIFPNMFDALDHGVVGRAKSNGLISLNFWNPRDYANNSYRKIDDAPYGGGPGMVMMVEPLRRALATARSIHGSGLIVYLTPQGKLFNDQIAKELAVRSTLFMVAGRYEGIDERLMKLEPGLEISLGDYILSGGELAIMVLIDAITRQLPKVLGDENSVKNDSLAQGLLKYPQYTRPQIVENLAVPPILLNGDHRKIETWRRKQALGRTQCRRPDLMQKIELTAADRMLLNDFIGEVS